MKLVRRSWKVGLVFLLLLLVFGPVTCTFLDRGSDLTGPVSEVGGTAAGNFYASRGLYDDKYGVYVRKGEFVLNIPTAGRHWIFYQTTVGGFVLVTQIAAPALIYVGLGDQVEVTNIFSDVVPQEIALPNAAQQQIALKAADPEVTLLVKTTVLPVYTTDISYCQDEACIMKEMMNWIVQTPGYTWPDGRTEGPLADLYQLTQGSAFKASAAASQDDSGKGVLGISALLSSAVRYCSGGCGCYSYPCGCTSETEIWNAQNETCTQNNVEEMDEGDVSELNLANGETCEGNDDCSSNYCNPNTKICEEQPSPGGGGGPVCSSSNCGACGDESSCWATSYCFWDSGEGFCYASPQ